MAKKRSKDVAGLLMADFREQESLPTTLQASWRKQARVRVLAPISFIALIAASL